MNFHQFAADHGLIIDRIESGKWVRVPTVGKPHKKNGSYFYDQDFGHVQDWAAMDKCATWREDRPMSPIDLEAQRQRMAASQKQAIIERKKLYLKAAQKAAALISRAQIDTHPYLKQKGFPEATALVLDGALLIPMRDCNDNALLGLQEIKLVDNEWQKKMIFGMRAKGAVFRIGKKTSRETYMVEGYATGLSIDSALRLARLNASVLVCFSAGNLVHVASLTSGKRYVFADNDKSGAGEKAAKECGLPYCMSDDVGEDANDLHQRSGLLAVVSKIMEVRRC